MTSNGPVLPDTRACAASMWVAREYCSVALFNHSVRSFVWAGAVADLDGLDFDSELLFVSAMLHDIGLTQHFDNHSLPFEVAGGHVARVFAAGVGWSASRGSRTAEVIERHMWPSVDPDMDAEGYLLEVGTGVDISGGRAEQIPAQLRDLTLSRWPRAGLAEEFTTCFQDQGRRKPGSRTAARADAVARSLAQHPFDGPTAGR
jgi:hypothetical protein